MAALQGLQNFGNYALDAALEQNATKTQQSRLLSQFGNRALPDLNNAYAARGTFYGGSRSVAGQRATEDTMNQYGDLETNLQRTLAGLRRSGILAATGVAI